MDRLNLEKAILAGHSLAGAELTHFAAKHPTRVEKLIYEEHHSCFIAQEELVQTEMREFLLE